MNSTDQAIKDFTEYGKRTNLITPDETEYSVMRILSLFGKNDWEEPEDTVFNHLEDAKSAIDEGWLLDEILKQFTKEAVKAGICRDEKGDLEELKAKLMDCIMPRPHELNDAFHVFYRKDAREATAWFSEFSKNAAISGDKTMLNYRAVPVDICGEPWELAFPQPAFFDEYFSLTYCGRWPIDIASGIYDRVVDFINKFPGYNVCAAIDLGEAKPFEYRIIGGKERFPIESADMLGGFGIEEFSGVRCFISEWPLSTIRLVSYNEICSLASRISKIWQRYGEGSNTSYVLARNTGDVFEADIVLLKAGKSPDITEVFGLKREGVTADAINPASDCVFPDNDEGHKAFETFIERLQKGDVGGE